MTGPENSGVSGPWVVCEHVARAFTVGEVLVAAVEDVSLTVAGRTRAALTGPSGSGKSTLLHLLAGLEVPTSGRVEWPGLGGSPAGRPDAVGVVFQGPSLVPDLDVAENVGLSLLLAGHTPAGDDVRAAVAGALDRVEVGDLADKLPEELSGGQAQRVALARVLVTRPRVILADEPTGQLDGDTGARIVTALLDTADDLGAALVVATHDPRVAERLTDRWSMRDGRLEPEPPRSPDPAMSTDDPAPTTDRDPTTGVRR